MFSFESPIFPKGIAICEKRRFVSFFESCLKAKYFYLRLTFSLIQANHNDLVFMHNCITSQEFDFYFNSTQPFNDLFFNTTNDKFLTLRDFLVVQNLDIYKK
jgi:hypothetical protein